MWEKGCLHECGRRYNGGLPCWGTASETNRQAVLRNAAVASPPTPSAASDRARCMQVRIFVVTRVACFLAAKSIHQRTCILSLYCMRGVGIDIAHIPRFAAALSRWGPARLCARILHPHEVSDFEAKGKTTQAQFLASRCVMCGASVFLLEDLLPFFADGRPRKP